MQTQPTIVVTYQDFERIQAAIGVHQGMEFDRLDRELERATLVSPETIADEIVTMNSKLVYEDLSSGKRRTVQLVYPQDANAAQDKISVLAPLGSALIGLREGDQIEWVMPAGNRTLKIVELIYQPEAAGDWSL